MIGATATSAQVVSSGGRARLGRIVASTGSDVLVMMDGRKDEATTPHLGDMVVIGSHGKTTIGIVSGLNEPAPGLEDDAAEIWLAQVELVGTLGNGPGNSAFTRAVAISPTLGDVAYKATPSDLRRLFRNGDEAAYPIGVVQGHTEVAATIDPKPLLSGGFAILGDGGSGKSCTLASMVRALLRHRHEARIVLIDPYNEYSRSFGKAAVAIEPGPGFLPHWLLSFSELQWALSQNGGPLDADECSLLEEAIPAARLKFRQKQGHGRQAITAEDKAAATVESPMPYRLLDIVSYIEKLPQVDDHRDGKAFRRLRTRVTASMSDPRLSIFFSNTTVTDNLDELFKRVFRLERGGAPMSVLQIGNLATGVDRVAVSVICRLATALAEWGDGAFRTLLLIEDAGRYAPADPRDGSAELSLAAMRSLGGRPRKLGTTIGLVSADARTINRDVIGQCATYFVHRLTSHTEIETVEDLLPDAASAFLGGVSNLGIAEAVGVGQGVPLTGRIQITPLPDAAVPTEHANGAPPMSDSTDQIQTIVRRWRECGAGAAASDLPEVL